MTLQNFIEQTIRFFPDIAGEKEKHIEEYGEMLATIFFEESIMPRVIDLLMTDTEYEKLRDIFYYFEDVSINADENLDNIFSITILEMLGNDRDILEIAKKYMGPETSKKQRQADIDLGRSVS
ncbi:DUF7674 family protein [Butyrivibrio sp. INlla21]|uniref:DUF7674 family protein n=1 Tax=Butyrivibrio sp. INlla21 TaxID=1520811 RepID=UPI0008ECE8EF|nr:hypothetical protein [Butyrivibrio sp. INlla21]SFU30869.1 hypothetical protein SAMN02910342_00011 [Butyrivibrio sp. INlla21]